MRGIEGDLPGFETVLAASAEWLRLAQSPERVRTLLPEIKYALRVIEDSDSEATPEAARKATPTIGGQLPDRRRDAFDYLMLVLTVAQLVAALLQMRTPPAKIEVYVSEVATDYVNEAAARANSSDETEGTGPEGGGTRTGRDSAKRR